jgi:thiamine-monophosphate kinase
MAPRIEEFELIARYFAPLAASSPGALGLLDDAAYLKPAPGQDIVVTADAVVEGIHFLPDSDPARVARRVLRVNLSDLAAKGARPLAYTLTIQVRRGLDEDWFAAFAAALGADQREYGVALLGGDTTSTSGPLSLSVNMFGEVSENSMIKRSVAGIGDDVYVSGTIGDAGLGLELEMGLLTVTDPRDSAFLRARFHAPEPRLALGRSLVGQASAAADVSDGLVADLGHICRASGIAAEILLSAVPLSPAARRAVTDDQPFHLSLLGRGDDYEIVFTAPERARAAIEACAARAGVGVARIGRTRAAAGSPAAVTVRDDAGNRLEVTSGGFRHFQDVDAG